MFEVRIHGRGGQGVVTAAELLSLAAFDEGRYAQAFPSFGSERMGAPVVAFCRIDDREIRTREPVAQPDALIVQDPTLLHQVDVFAGLDRDGFILINTARSFDELGLGQFAKDFRHERLLTVPASELAREHTGRAGRERRLARRLRGAQRADLARRGHARDPRAVRRSRRRGERRGGAGSARVGQRGAAGAERCHASLRARAPSPRPSRCAGPR